MEISLRIRKYWQGTVLCMWQLDYVLNFPKYVSLGDFGCFYLPRVLVHFFW